MSQQPSAQEPLRPTQARVLSLVVTQLRVRALAIAVGTVIVTGAYALYVSTAARDIVFGDTPELTAVAATFGVAHPPGYPLFTMLGWVFAQLPVGPLPFRVVLLSVVCHAATVGIVYGAAWRFTRSVPAAAVAAAALAVQPLFWAWSLVAEVFPLNDLLSATMLLLVALWHEHPERPRLLIAGGLVGGLGMADHQTIALLSPAVFYVMWRRRDVLLRDVSLVGKTSAAFAAGLLPYLVLLTAAARHPAWSWGDLRTPGDLIGHFLRQSYGTSALLVGAQFTGGSAVDRVLALLTAFDPLQWILVAVGMAYAWRVRRWYVTYLLIGFFLAGPVFTLYSNANVTDETTHAVLERFFLMPQVVVAPLAGFAVVAVRDLAATIWPHRRAAELAMATAGMVGALAFVPLEYRQIDQSNNHYARTFANDLLSSLNPNTVFLGAGDPVLYPLGYVQTIEGARPDVVTVATPLIVTDWYVRELRRSHPDLVVPNDRYGAGGAPFRSFIDANRRRPIAALGDLPDDSTTGVYWFYARGLVYDVRPREEIVTLEQMASESEAVLSRYHPPRYDDVVGPRRVWERLTLVDYAQGYSRVGREYENAADSFTTKDAKRVAELYADAVRWYRRALQVDPKLTEAARGIERSSR